jgi:hypothetical protein
MNTAVSHFEQHISSLLKIKIMNKMLVVVFDNESNAYEGLNALPALTRKRVHYPVC